MNASAARLLRSATTPPSDGAARQTVSDNLKAGIIKASF
jgi:hypothetical protein